MKELLINGFGDEKVYINANYIEKSEGSMGKFDDSKAKSISSMPPALSEIKRRGSR